MRHQGFTLIEILIAVAILGFLAAIAYPSYTDYVRRGKLPEATSNLLAMRTKLEQYYQDNKTYAGACQPKTVAALPANQKYFNITCPTLTATNYTLVATGQGDLSWITYQITEANARSTTVTSGLAPSDWQGNANCWVTKKNGQC